MISLQPLFTRRAALAALIGQAERHGQPVPPGALRRYRIVQRQLARAVVDESVPPVPLTPEWCTLCGSALSPKLAGHLMCLGCEAQIAHDEAINRLRTLPYECPETDE